jgi:hypothetical protein
MPHGFTVTFLVIKNSLFLELPKWTSNVWILYRSIFNNFTPYLSVYGCQVLHLYHESLVLIFLKK